MMKTLDLPSYTDMAPHFKQNFLSIKNLKTNKYTKTDTKQTYICSCTHKLFSFCLFAYMSYPTEGRDMRVG